MKYLLIIISIITAASVLFIPSVRSKLPVINSFGGVGVSLPDGSKLQKYFTEFSGLFQSGNSQDISSSSKTILKVGLVSDSHGSAENLQRAMRDMTVSGVNYVLHLGDFTAGGELQYFQEAKDILDGSGIPYSVIPGDHDFNWLPSYSRSNYEAVFGPLYQEVIELNSVTLILFDNSDTSVDQPEKKTWLAERFANKRNTAVLFTSDPLYSEYFAYKSDERGPEIIAMLEESGVKYAVAGNTHVYSEYSNASGSITFVTVGAIGEYKNPLAQWVLMEVKSNGTVDFKPQPLVEF